MRIALLSDIHIEFQRDLGREFIELYLTDLYADALVIAGDTAPATMLLPFFQRVRGVYAGPIVTVRGNHEYYGYSMERVDACYAELTSSIPDFHELNDSAVTINNQRLLGGTGWFPSDPNVEHYAKHLINDFRCINNLDSFVYSSNTHTHEFLRTTVGPQDIVVTHHAPITACIDPQFAGARTNHFFVSQFDDIVTDNQPRLWLHGHMHHRADFTSGDTRIIRNPHGIGSQETNDFTVRILEV